MRRRDLLLGTLTGALVTAAIVFGIVLATRDEAAPKSTAQSTRRHGTPVTNCEERVGFVSQKPQWDTPPAMQIDQAKSYTATLATSKGEIVIDLDPKAAPRTVNNFIFLARCGFYDGVTFHRIARNFVIQGGDPSGTGRGGPGYTFPDELPPSPGYPVGAVAMANAGPNTNGSQFFIVTGTGASSLPNNYSLFGRVVRGQEVGKAIQDLQIEGDASDGRPVESVTISTVTIVES